MIENVHMLYLAGTKYVSIFYVSALKYTRWLFLSSNIVFVKFSRHVGVFSSHNGVIRRKQPSNTGIWRDFAQPQWLGNNQPDLLQQCLDQGLPVTLKQWKISPKQKIYKGLKVELETPFSDLNTRSCRTAGTCIKAWFHDGEILRTKSCVRNAEIWWMAAHEWFYWICTLFSLSQWVERTSTHWRSEIFSREA
jgi:hypothetical protein